MDNIHYYDQFFMLSFIIYGVNVIRLTAIKQLQQLIYGLAGLRIALCMMPQNDWLSAAAPLSWGIYRNIPFALLGLLIIVLFYRSAKENNDKVFSLGCG